MAALRHDLQTLRDKGTVQSAKGGYVGNRTECNQVQQINEARFGTLVKIAAPTQFTEQCRAPQESDANCRQVPMRYAHIAFVKPVGVDQCMGDRPCCRAFMVIDDDAVAASGRAPWRERGC